MKKLTSLGDLAKELGVNKSKLFYYSKVGLIKKIETVSNVDLYDYEKTITVLKKIDKFQGNSKRLNEILKILN
jgi:DNA-binding transcriptional MerR regulator